jgi:hypothetical protein
MATYYSTRYALREGGSSTTAADWIEQSSSAQRMGELIVITGQYTFTGSEATNDTVTLCSVPKYGKLVSWQHAWDDCGTTVTTDLEGYVAAGTTVKGSLALGTANTTGTGLTSTECAAQWAAHAATAGYMRLKFTSVSTPTATSVYGFVAVFARGTGAYA